MDKEFLDKIQSVKGTTAINAVIDSYLEEVNRDEEILFTIDYYVKNIETYITHLDEDEDTIEVKKLIGSLKSRLESIKEKNREKLEIEKQEMR